MSHSHPLLKASHRWRQASLPFAAGMAVSALPAAVGPQEWFVPAGTVAVICGIAALTSVLISEKRYADYANTAHQHADNVERDAKRIGSADIAGDHLAHLPPAIDMGRHADPGRVHELTDAEQDKPDAQAQGPAVTGSQSRPGKSNTRRNRGDVPPFTDQAERIVGHHNTPESH